MCEDLPDFVITPYEDGTGRIMSAILVVIHRNWQPAEWQKGVDHTVYNCWDSPRNNFVHDEDNDASAAMIPEKLVTFLKRYSKLMNTRYDLLCHSTSRTGFIWNINRSLRGHSGNWSTEVQLRYVVNGVLIIPIFTHIVNLLKRCVSEKNGPCNMSLVDSASSCI